MKLAAIVALTATLSTSALAQNFVPAARTFSHKAESTVTLVDGTELRGTVKDVDRKKGLVKLIKIEADGKKHKLKATDVASAYLKPSGINQVVNALELAGDSQRWGDGLDSTQLLGGYVYLEQVPLTFKRGKKERRLLVQLINPFSAGGVRVFEDPAAKQTLGASVGGVTVAGGNAKSYYMQKGDETAVRVFKKNYDEEFAFYFGDCPAVTSADDAGKWRGVQEHVNTYAAECAE